MWETTFQRLAHVGLGKPINDGRMWLIRIDMQDEKFTINPTNGRLRKISPSTHIQL
jgi:hypothetical protein